MQKSNLKFFADIPDDPVQFSRNLNWLAKVRTNTAAPRIEIGAGTAYANHEINLPISNEFDHAMLTVAIDTVNNLVPVSFLEKGALIARSVGKVSGNRPGTGTLVGKDLLLTNNHVIDSAESAEHAFVEFQKERDINGDLKQIDRREIVELLDTDDCLDYSLLRMKGTPGDDYGFIDITNPATPIPGDPSNGYPIIIQHSNGGEKKIAVTDNHVVGVRAPHFHYTTDTTDGTSGSLVFSHDWVPMGLHRAGKYVGKDPQGRRRARNEGVLLSAILANLQSKGVFSSDREIHKRMRTLLQNPLLLPDPTSAPDIGWFYQSNFQSVLVNEADGNYDIAPLVAVAVGVAAGASAAHWGHVTSKETFMSQEMSIKLDFSAANLGENTVDLTPHYIVPANSTPYGIFELAYPTVRQLSYLPIMKMIVDQRRSVRPEDFEMATLAAAFLAGVAAGASAYSAGK